MINLEKKRVGWVFQPTMVGKNAHPEKYDLNSPKGTL